ncbi:MAG: hypothetical protein IKB70_00445 [Bacilli bacterium]|nr:hypothetical protein [Bacilli bacterium]
MQKKYAIVRVDNTWCPNKFENIDNRFVCDSRRKNIKRVHCERCNYGDTKEQLIKKVAQVLIKDEMKYCKWETKVHKEVCWQNNMELAKEIVEFLGVE